MTFIFVFILGAAVGSFVNVLASRVVAEKSIVVPRSFCDACASPLLRRDMIPIVSFLVLRARCRLCRAHISWQYPIVEAVVAGLFVVAFFTATSSVHLLLLWFAIVALVTLFLTDLRAMVLPDTITVPAIIIALALDLFLHRPLVALGIALAVGGGFFLVQYLVSRGKWIGSGDIRLGLLMAAVLGSWQFVAAALIISYIVGSLVSIILLIMKKKGLASEVPLGAFLAAGTLIVMLYGSQFIPYFLGQ